MPKVKRQVYLGKTCVFEPSVKQKAIYTGCTTFQGVVSIDHEIVQSGIFNVFMTNTSMKYIKGNNNKTTCQDDKICTIHKIFTLGKVPVKGEGDKTEEKQVEKDLYHIPTRNVKTAKTEAKPHQSAYRKGHSCETMLVKLADHKLNEMECQEISAVVACDLSAAFDTVNISVLLSTFHIYYSITGDVLNWLESYLTDQSCSVMINGKKSPPKHLTLSVPQGSCSGAYFFIMYAATLFEIVQEIDLFVL